MAKRLFDILFSLFALLLSIPLLVIAAVGIVLTSPGPIIYRAQRAGLNGKEFVMHKFRTMQVNQKSTASAITGVNDPRIFPFGAFLRKLKIDELPQLFDVIRGEMSIVGPRPESPHIISNHYTIEQMQTLTVLPGLVSPGGIYNYTHGNSYLEGEHAEQLYTDYLLDKKLALELVYVANSSFLYDLKIIIRTVWVIICVGCGRNTFPNPPEMKQALKFMRDQTQQ